MSELGKSRIDILGRENIGLDYAVEQVKEFHKAFNHPVAEKPVPMDLATAKARTNWTAEELVEFLFASAGGDHFVFMGAVEQLHDSINKTAESIIKKDDKLEWTESDILVGQVDALIDADYFIKGSYTVMGVKPQPFFDIVQKANMGKLHNGVAKYREEDGKIQKPENWERDFAPEPRIVEELKRQLKDNG